MILCLICDVEQEMNRRRKMHAGTIVFDSWIHRLVDVKYFLLWHDSSIRRTEWAKILFNERTSTSQHQMQHAPHILRTSYFLGARAFTPISLLGSPLYIATGACPCSYTMSPFSAPFFLHLLETSCCPPRHVKNITFVSFLPAQECECQLARSTLISLFASDWLQFITIFWNLTSSTSTVPSPLHSLQTAVLQFTVPFG